MSAKIRKLTIGKGVSREKKNGFWEKSYYELEIQVTDDSDIPMIKANSESLLLGWLSSPSEVHSPLAEAPNVEVPDIDLYTLEHDENWRSWKKDATGKCSFKAEEGKSAWIRISKADNTVLTLVKAMKRKSLEKVTLGAFEYRLSGEDFLQRRAS